MLLSKGEKSEAMDCCMKDVMKGYTRTLSSRLSAPGRKRDALERTMSATASI